MDQSFNNFIIFCHIIRDYLLLGCIIVWMFPYPYACSWWGMIIIIAVFAIAGISYYGGFVFIYSFRDGNRFQIFWSASRFRLKKQ